MKNNTNERARSVAELAAAYPQFVAEIRKEAAATERARLKKFYNATTSDGVRLMEQAAEQANSARRARSH